MYFLSYIFLIGYMRVPVLSRANRQA